MMQTVATTLSGDNRIDAELGTGHWASTGGATLVTFSFPDASSAWSGAAGDYGGGTSEPATGFAALSTSQQDAVRAALRAWSNVANVTFAEMADNGAGAGTLRFGWTASSLDEQSHAYAPGTNARAGDVWLNSLAPWDGFAPGSYGYSTLLHETGHALGLVHPGEGGVALPAAQNGYANTLMSENADADSPGSWVSFEPTTPMLYDILAMQALYGANHAFNSGADTYTFHQGSTYFQTIWDGGGVNTIVWDATTQGATIDLRAGHWSTLGNPLTYWSSDFGSTWTDPDTVAIAFGTLVRNAVGGGSSDTLIGNDADNRLQGGGGNDTIVGGSGTDTAIFTGALAGYSLARAGGVLTVADHVASHDGTDTLTGVERLQFQDFTVNLTVQAAAASGITSAQVHRLEELYVAFFNRTPDADGLEYWIGRFKAGLTVNQIAESFYNAGVQYSNITGYSATMTNADFVNAVYRNVLGRQNGADETGLLYWTTQLANGTETHGSLVSQILNSAHTYKGNPYGEAPGQWGQVPDLLDNKITVAQTVAVAWGLNYNTPEQSIAQGMAIAAAVTPTDTSAALALVGVNPANVDLPA